MKVLTQMLEAILTLLDVLFSSISGIVAMFSKVDHRHKSSFGDGEFLSKRNTGFNVNGLQLSPILSRRGLLIQGETGSGKGIASTVKSCMVVEGSQIVHAASEDLFQLTSGFRSYTDRILVFCPTDPLRSFAYNPMLRANSLSEISRLSHLIVSLFSAKDEKSSFWNNKAKELLTVCMCILKKTDAKYDTLPNVALLLDFLASESSRPYVNDLFADLADDWLFQKYEAICSQSDTVFQGVVSSAQASVQFFDLDDSIRSLVSHDELGDFENLRKERTSLYLISSPSKATYYGPLMSILLDQLMESFFSRIPEEDELDVYFHLDESPVLRLENLDLICANIRKHRGSICLVAQDPHAQFASIYGEHKRNAILSNLKTKAYYSINFDTAKRLEQELGIFTYEDEYDESKMKTRSLRTATELMQLGEREVLITHSGEPPVLSDFTPYFEDYPYSDYAKLPPVDISEQELPPVHLLPLKKMYPNADQS